MNSVFQDDVTFWSERFREHAMLLFILLDPNQALFLKERARKALENWTQANTLDFNKLLDELLTLKSDVLTQSQSSRNPINHLLSKEDFETLLLHMIREFKFFVNLLQNSITPKEEIEFWTQENVEHTELSAHLLPSGQLKDTIQKTANDLKHSQDYTDLISKFKVSNIMAVELDRLIQERNQGAIDAVIHIILEHEIKEGLRGQQRLETLLSTQ